MRTRGRRTEQRNQRRALRLICPATNRAHEPLGFEGMALPAPCGGNNIVDCV